MKTPGIPGPFLSEFFLRCKSGLAQRWQRVAAFVNYLNTTPANDTGEPLDVAVTPPTSDTDEATDA